MGIEVRSLEALPELGAALARFHERAAGALELADASARRALERLDVAIRRREYEVDRLQREYDELDDEDDGDALRDRIDEAEERLRRVQEAREDVASREEAFRRTAKRAAALMDDAIPAARALLDRKHGELQQYVALAPPGHRSTPPFAPAPSTTASAALPRATVTAAPGVALPPGFAWVAVDAMEEVELAADEFRKVTEDEIARGFAVLTECVLPALAARGAVGSDFFGDGDRAAGVAYAEGAQRVYDAFLGTDAIRLTRRSRDAVWSITNGRHRIQVARRLGITHVPARAAETG